MLGFALLRYLVLMKLLTKKVVLSFESNSLSMCSSFYLYGLSKLESLAVLLNP